MVNLGDGLYRDYPGSYILTPSYPAFGESTAKILMMLMEDYREALAVVRS